MAAQDPMRCAMCCEAPSSHPIWLEILFRDRPFPEHHGLHLFGKLGPAGSISTSLGSSASSMQGNIAGAKFGIGGIPILLAFGEPHFEDPGTSSFFPTRIRLRSAWGTAPRR